ncbi:3-hydroxyisobutyrate dehydrogenase [Blastomonas natatoria]|uniref:3-hydroxyisobutyrate dehydrogenase n=1 Tax=Blastomonas natatoria TaxID=34015 RepID=A0A2V3VEA8_9SPHN|nr:3-hydroxyisobutyrate dehydrogenase [Blastomonas natatoria]PXW79108.1 3-hydroxyisobutyrate dehydrogenase [Blastomonas natatoria]
MSTIGFIGLGNMGGGMAANLAKAGHKVIAFDLSGEALARAGAAGCHPVSDPAQAVGEADVVVTMLPAGKHVASVYNETVFGAAKAGTLLIDCSTIDVDTAREVAAAAKARGLEAVDAPVSGGIAAANGGTLTFMVGGSADGFARAEPILADMGKAVIHAGDNGAGQAAKICNNMLLGATMAATCETFMLAKKLGLDLQTFYDISSKASGQSWSMTSYCPVPGVGPASPADNGYAGGFAAALMLKDMRLAMEAAKASGAAVPMGERAEAIYAAFVEADAQGLDFSAIITALE